MLFKDYDFEYVILSILNLRVYYLTRFFFISNAFFSAQPQCCLTFSWIEHQILPKCYSIHISIIILRHFLYLLYLCPCLDLDLFMSYLRDLFLIFIFILIMINRIIFRICPIVLDDNVDEECEKFSNSINSGCCLAFAWFFYSRVHIYIQRLTFLYSAIHIYI